MSYYVIALAEAKQPEYREKKKEGYMEYGKDNNYPSYLVDLFNKSSKHAAIIRNKVHYICGNGWEGESTFVKQVNRVESLNDLTRKVSLDIELFGGAYLEIIWGLNGYISEVWHCDYTKFRTNKDNTQFWYKEDWKDLKKQPVVYPKFNPENRTGRQILYIKEYRPMIGVYSLPVYFGALNYIESDIEVSKHVLGNAKTGFAASKLITLVDGEATDEEQREIHNKFKNTYTGSDGVKYMLSFVNDASRKPIIDDLGQSDLTKEDFTRVDELIQTNIFSGHQITTPSIFGIAVAGKLGNRTEMRDGYEIFKNTYVNGKQMFIESVFNNLIQYTNYVEEIKIIPTEPVGIEFSENVLSQIMTKDEMREKIGLNILEENTNADTQDVIDAINSLSPLVANKVLEQLTPNELRALISLPPKEEGQNIPDASVTETAPTEQPTTQFNLDDSNSFEIFEEFGEAPASFNIWKSKELKMNWVGFDSQIDIIESDMEFADVTQIQSNVLDLLAKDKRITPEIIASTLKEDIGVIKRVLSQLEERGYIKVSENKIGKGDESNIITERVLTEPLSTIVEKIKPKTSELLIRYSYDWKQGYSDADIDTSRDFCKYLLKANKFYSRADIEMMSSRLGYSVWDRRGGWWTMPNGEHSVSCRHVWKANVVTRKK